MKIVKVRLVESAKEIEEAIRKNDGYCPCELEKNEDTKCICKRFREQAFGTCTCGLYQKEE